MARLALRPLGLERSTPALAGDNSLHLLWRVVGDIVTAALLCQVLPVEVPVRALCTYTADKL